MMTDYKNLLNSFDGQQIMCCGTQNVTETMFASFLFGMLLQKAYAVSGLFDTLSAAKGTNQFPYFVVDNPKNKQRDISKSLAGKHFIDASAQFSQREIAAMTLLLGWVGECNEVAFLAGYTCNYKI